MLLVRARGILDSSRKLREFRLCVAIFFLVVENLRAAFLQIPARRRIFAAHRGFHLLKAAGRRLAFIRERIFVIEKLIVFCRASELARLLVRLRAQQQQRGLCGCACICFQRFNRSLRLARFHRRWSVSFEELFPNPSIRIFGLDFLQRSERRPILLQHALRLRRPIQNIVGEQRVALGLRQPDHCRLRVIFVVIVVTQRQRRARTPNISGILPRKRRELVVRARSRVMQRTRHRRKFALCRFVFRRRRRNLRRRSVRHAAERHGVAAGLLDFRFLCAVCAAGAEEAAGRSTGVAAKSAHDTTMASARDT